MSKRVCVYCSSSNTLDNKYNEAAEDFAKAASLHNYTIVCGGSIRGLMGTIIDTMLSNNGSVEGIIPQFMQDIEIHHPNLANLTIVDTMSRRKELLRENCDAVVALPGGIGTLDELFEVFTLKKLDMYAGKVMVLNIYGFFDPLISLLDHLVKENCLCPNYRKSLLVFNSIDELIQAINSL